MKRIVGTRKKEPSNDERVSSKNSDKTKKWWKFNRKAKVKPSRELDIRHNVQHPFNGDEFQQQSFEMGQYFDRNNHHYGSHQYDDNFLIRNDGQLFVDEYSRDSLESSENGSEHFQHKPRNPQINDNRTNFNHITQHIHNNNNKITIIIRHEEKDAGSSKKLRQPIIYIQPSTSHQNLVQPLTMHQQQHETSEIYNSLDELDSDEHYQFYNESAVDVPDNFKRASYLVLNLNDSPNKRMKRRICTPLRNLNGIDYRQHETLLPGTIDRISQNTFIKTKRDQIRNHLPVVKNTQNTVQTLSQPKRDQRRLQTEPKKPKTFATQKKLLKEYYNWNVDFPSTKIHENSILFRDDAQMESFRRKLRIMGEKSMTMGRVNLGNTFGGSCKELSPSKIKNKTLLDNKLAKSELSLNDVQKSSVKNISSSLLNLIAMPFNFKSRTMASQRNNRDKKKNNVLTNLWRKKRNDGLVCTKKIQDSDGGFFEKFGQLLHQRNEDHDEIVLGSAALVDQDAASFLTKDGEAKDEVESRFLAIEEEGDTGKDSGNESITDDSDSEEKKEESMKDIRNALVGMNIEELYEEVLYEIIHNVGSDESQIDEEKLFSFVQEAFKFGQEAHEELLEKSRTKEAPELRLNIEVIEAKDLNSKDPNGLADPFVTLYIASAPNTRYTSSVKSATLNPKYEEHFSLPINENPNDETLVIEVWDFDPAETVGEKMNKIFEVKGVKGLRKFMKEIAVTASSGKHDNEFVGSSKVLLKSVPAAGLVMWYNLDKKNKTKSQGTIKLRLNFSSEKNDQVASQEHRHLLKVLLYHELESSQVAHHWWSGKFSDSAEKILTQHSAQSGLTAIDVAFAQWSVFTEIHLQHPLAFDLFERILDILIRPIQTQNVNHQEELNIFWESTKRLLPSCFGMIRKLRKKLAGDQNAIKHLTSVLNIISKVSMLEPPENYDLFPEQLYGWLKRPKSSTNWDIREAMNDAVNIGTSEYFDSVIDQNELNSDDNEVRLQQLIKVIQLVRSDLQRAIEHHDKVFQETMNYQYAGILYKTYDAKLMELVKPTVIDICNTKIERLDMLDQKDMKHNRYEEINMMTTLFELYLLLKRFSVLGSALCPGEMEFQMKEYYDWFSGGVAHWLDISVYKALTRIQKAIELDSLIAVDDSVKYSSSAVDTLAIFYQIRIFWQQLAWPNAEGAFIFVSKIVDDICRCCVYYADKMAERVDKLGMVETVYEKKFQVTDEWCLAINNIDYIRQSIHSFVNELGVEKIIRDMADFRGPMDAQRCKDTLKNVIENAVDTENNKILELIEKLSKKMSPAMRRFLTEGAELFDTDSNSMDRLMMYMEDSLKTLHTELNDDNFDRVLDAIWQELSFILYDLVQNSLDKRRPPSFYSNLRNTLHIMIENFKCQNTSASKPIQSSDKETLEHIDKLLELHGYETADLIHQYYKDRYKMQCEMTSTPFGILTVQCYFQGNILEIEIMNAKSLVPMDTDGSCDPFVRIHFFPDGKFVGVTQPKTKMHNKTLFPLFDEKFSITLSTEQRSLKDAIIMFSVKDQDYFGMANQYVAEAFLSFKDISDITSDNGSVKQMPLTLSRPKNEDMDAIRALQYRVGDKLAKEFLKKLKTKLTDSTAK